MNVLKYFEFFGVEVTKQASPFYIQTMADDMDGVLRADFPCLIRPSQMIGINGVAALRVNHQWLRPVRKKKVLGLGIQGPFIPMHRHFPPLYTEQRHGDVVQNRPLVLFVETRLLRVDLPLHFVPFGLRKGELGNDGIGLINGARRCGRGRRRRGGVGHEEIDQEAHQSEAKPQ